MSSLDLDTLDTTAEAFGELLLSASRSRRKIPLEEDGARMWLNGVARDVLRNTRRTLARQSVAVQQLRQEVGTDAAVSSDPVNEAVAAAVSELPADDVELLRLICWDGLPSHEAAAILGINPSAARSRLTRVRATPRTLLEAQSEEHDLRASTT